MDKLILPELVRATAINASRARRTTLNNHCELYDLIVTFSIGDDLRFCFFSYEERYRILNSIIRTHKKETTYEEFLAKSFTPLATKTLCKSLNDSREKTSFLFHRMKKTEYISVRRYTFLDLKVGKEEGRPFEYIPIHLLTFYFH